MGLGFTGFRLYPLRYSYLFENRGKSLIIQLFDSGWVNFFGVPLLCYMTLQSIDSLHAYMAVPMVLWFSVAMTGVFTAQYLLKSPLWLAQTYKLFGTFCFASSLPFAYRAFINKVNYHEYEQTFATY